MITDNIVTVKSGKTTLLIGKKRKLDDECVLITIKWTMLGSSAWMHTYMPTHRYTMKRILSKWMRSLLLRNRGYSGYTSESLIYPTACSCLNTAVSINTPAYTYTHADTHMHFHASKSAWYSANCCFCHCWVWPSASVCMCALLTVNISRRSCLLHAGCVYSGCTDAQRLDRRLCWWSRRWTPRAKLYWHLAARTFFSCVLGEFTYLQIHSSSYLLRPEQVAELLDPFHPQRISD